MTKQKITIRKSETTYVEKEVEIEFPLYIDATDYNECKWGQTFVMIDELYVVTEVFLSDGDCKINKFEYILFPEKYFDDIDYTIEKSEWDLQLNKAINYIKGVANDND